MSNRAIWAVALSVAVLLGYVALRLFMVFYTDLLWFSQMGYRPTFMTMAGSKVLCFLAFGSAFLLVAGLNVWIAHRNGLITRIMPLEVVVDGEGATLPERLKRQKWVWGGVVAAMADVAGGIAAFSLFEAGADILTVEIKINYLAPAGGEALIARGEVIKSGRTLTIVRSEIFAVDDAAETLCAAGMGTLMTRRQ